jgi:hypothetical protein
MQTVKYRQQGVQGSYNLPKTEKLSKSFERRWAASEAQAIRYSPRRMEAVRKFIAG